jgi:hypothetical protein
VQSLVSYAQTLSTAIIGSAAQITSMRQQYEAQIQELQDKYDIKVSLAMLPTSYIACMSEHVYKDVAPALDNQGYSMMLRQ